MIRRKHKFCLSCGFFVFGVSSAKSGCRDRNYPHTTIATTCLDIVSSFLALLAAGHGVFDGLEKWSWGIIALLQEFHGVLLADVGRL